MEMTMQKAQPYEPLWQYVAGNDAQSVTLSFSEIERVLGFPINHAFLNSKKDLHAYGWLCRNISMKENLITFLRLPEHATVVQKAGFSVIGKEGSTDEGEGFIQRLWKEANSQFDTVAQLAKKDGDENLCGIWGLMTDFSRSYKPWTEHFTSGLYLAGVECIDNAIAPEGWTRWTVPTFEYLAVECWTENIFSTTIAFMKENKLPLAGSVHDFTEPKTGKAFMLFPMRRK